MNDKDYMKQALRLAEQGAGFTSPNPAVGAVVVKNGRIIGSGFHRQAGGPHAEVEALHAAGKAAAGATMYVTLEPCNHTGRTPPCTEAIIAAGIRSVHYAIPDPNPRAAGGHARMAAAGIAVHAGLCAAEAAELTRFFLHYVRNGRPYVIAKFAASLDGKIATRTGDSQWITGPEARQKGHELRHLVDGILVGAGTAVTDNPQLTTRLPRQDIRHPLRIVLDSRGRVPLDACLFQPDLPGQTLVATTVAMPDCHREALRRQEVEVVVLDGDGNGRVSLPALLEHLGKREITSLLVEGGGETLGAFFAAQLVNEVWAFLSPMIIGGQAAPGPVGGAGAVRLADALSLQNLTAETVGKDILLRGVVVNPAIPGQNTKPSPVNSGM